MSAVIGNPLLLGPEGYQISRSVRLRSSASAYFNRTLTTPTGTTKWTWSGWVKRGTLGASQTLFSGSSDVNNWGYFGFLSGDTLTFSQADAGSVTSTVTTTQVFRDPSAWYHIVVVFDSTQATAANRLLMYINGVQITSFGTATYLAQNTASRINTANPHQLGRYFSAANYLDGYLTEVNFIDGQALTPTSFGQFNSVTGVWQPIKYTGTYGTNGFYLNFSDNSAATAAAIGKDYSGNGNNWTPNNISVTSGVTYDSMLDVPTLYADGGNGRGNYCTLNPLQPASTTVVVPTDGNLKMTGTASGNNVTGTMAIQASTYFEGTVITGGGTLQFGVRNLSTSNTYVYDSSGNKVLAGTSTAYGASFTTNDVIGVAVDPVNLTLQFFKNGTSQGTITSAFPSGDYVPFFYASNTNSSAANFGQRPFTYTPPSGFNALNTQNLPAPTISNGALYMAATTYTGNGATGQSVVNSGNNTAAISFKPDFVWVKVRSTAGTDHYLADSVRGATKYLQSDTTAAEGTNNGITAFNSNGFSVGAVGDTNTNGATIVGWQWQAGKGTTSSNTSGSITSTVSVNATAGFSVVSFNSGTAGNKTVGHGLGVAPSLIITKNRDGVASWAVWSSSFSNTAQGYLLLNGTGAVTNDSRQWANTAPTSTVFSFESGYTFTASNNIIAYCFSAVRGYSAFGSYTGNGNSDGPFVFCGFRPRWVMIKKATGTVNANTGWYMFDSSRGTINVVGPSLRADLSDAETTYNGIDFLSNGFKLRIVDIGTNSSTVGDTYIYAAFSEVGFKYALGR